MHEGDFAIEGTFLLFVPWRKVVSQKLYIPCRGNFHTFRDPKGAYQVSPHDSGPKHNSATSLLTLQPCWDMVAIHYSIQGCMALISKQIWNLTVWKWVFMYFWGHCRAVSPVCLWALVRGGRIVGLCTTGSLWRILASKQNVFIEHFKLQSEHKVLYSKTINEYIKALNTKTHTSHTLQIKKQ